MIIVTLRKGADGLYYPVTTSDQLLTEHITNVDLEALNDKGLEKTRYVAAAHGWKVEVVSE